MEFCVDGIEGPTVGRERGNVAFNAPNIVDVMPDFGIVAATPPFARNSGQTFEDHESILRLLDIDEAGFTKGRRVKNLIPYSDDLVNGDNAAAPGTIITSANTITFGSQSNSRIEERTYTSGQDDNIERVFSLEISASDTASVGKEVTIGVKDGASPYSQNGGYSHTLTLTPTRITTTAAKLTPGQTGFFSLIRCDEVTEVKITVGKLQLEEVDGKANKAPSEYIPTTTAAVSKFYNTTNGNTVLNNVVTENEGTLLTGITGRLNEESSINIAYYSRDFGNAYWIKTGTPTLTQDQAGKDGVSNKAWTFDDTSGSVSENIARNITIADDSTWHTESIYVLKDNDETRFPRFELNLKDGTAQLIRVWLNTKTGVPFVNTPTGTTRYDVSDAGLYWRVELSVLNNSSGNVRAGVVISPARGTTIGASNSAATGSIVIDMAQLENKSKATSFIETTTGSKTRAKTSLQYDGGNFNQSEGALVIEITPHRSGLQTNASNGVIIGLSTSFLFHQASGAISSWDGSSTVNHAFIPTKGVPYKLAMSWGPAGRSIVIDGGAAVSGTYSGTVTATDIAILSQMNATWNFVNADSKLIKFFKEEKSVEFLQALTS